MTNDIKALSHEASLSYETYRVYCDYPALHGNIEVLKMLKEIDTLAVGNEYKAQTEQENRYQEGLNDGWENCQTEELQPLVESCRALFACADAPENSKLRSEFPEALQDLLSLIEGVQKRLEI